LEEEISNLKVQLEEARAAAAALVTVDVKACIAMLHHL